METMHQSKSITTTSSLESTSHSVAHKLHILCMKARTHAVFCCVHVSTVKRHLTRQLLIVYRFDCTLAASKQCRSSSLNQGIHKFLLIFTKRFCRSVSLPCATIRVVLFSKFKLFFLRNYDNWKEIEVTFSTVPNVDNNLIRTPLSLNIDL